MEAFARRFRCVCLDMDGTLCTNARHPDGHDRVTPRTAAALREYKACGGTVIVATGRPAGSSTSVVDRDLPGVVSFVVCCDGGCVLAPAAEAGGGWQPVWQSGLSGLAVARLLAAIAAMRRGLAGSGPIVPSSRAPGAPTGVGQPHLRISTQRIHHQPPFYITSHHSNLHS